MLKRQKQEHSSLSNNLQIAELWKDMLSAEIVMKMTFCL